MVRYATEIARGLATDRRIELHVISGQDATAFWKSHLGTGTSIHRAAPGGTAGRSLREWLSMGGHIPTDAVFHGTKHLLPRWFGGRRVLTVHDMLPLDRPRDFRRAKRTLLVGPYLDSLRRADALLCVSRATRARLTSYVPSTADRAAVIPLAMGTALRDAVPVPIHRLLDSKIVLVVGDPSPRKNVQVVLRAWPAILERHPDAILVLVGPPDWDARRGVAELPKATLALGHVSDGSLRWLYEHASVVACPSVLEGFGLPALEAQHFRAPLVTSEDAALCEVGTEAVRRASGRDPDAWVDAVSDALDQGRKNAGPSTAAPRTWSDVARETIDAALGAER